MRVAISGRTVSPPLYESIELLGRERTLARLAAARAVAGSGRRTPDDRTRAGPGADTGPPPTAVHRPAAQYAAPAAGAAAAAGPCQAVPAWPQPVLPVAPAGRRPAAAPGVRWAPPPGHAAARRPAAVPAGRCARATGPGGGRCSGLLLIAVVYFVAAVDAVAGCSACCVGATPARSPTWPRRAGRPVACCWSLNLSLIVAIPCVWLAWAVAHGMRHRVVVVGAGAGCAGGCSCRTRCIALATLGVGHRAVGAARRSLVGDEAVTGPVAVARLAARRRPAHHAAAVGGRGVRVPRLPEPGDRRLDPPPAGRRGRGRAASPRPLFSPRARARRTCRRSSTGSPSGWPPPPSSG